MAGEGDEGEAGVAAGDAGVATGAGAAAVGGGVAAVVAGGDWDAAADAAGTVPGLVVAGAGAGARVAVSCTGAGAPALSGRFAGAGAVVGFDAAAVADDVPRVTDWAADAEGTADVIESITLLVESTMNREESAGDSVVASAVSAGTSTAEVVPTAPAGARSSCSSGPRAPRSSSDAANAPCRQ